LQPGDGYFQMILDICQDVVHVASCMVVALIIAQPGSKVNGDATACASEYRGTVANDSW
jgi:hypothetical protein